MRTFEGYMKQGFFKASIMYNGETHLWELDIILQETDSNRKYPFYCGNYFSEAEAYKSFCHLCGYDWRETTKGAKPT